MITRVVKLDDPEAYDLVSGEAFEILRKGGLVVFPTETVYGLGFNASNPSAVQKVYEIKKRERNKPFTVHISSVEELSEYPVAVDDKARKLISEFWPGPLTIVLPIVEPKFHNKKYTIAEPLSGIIKEIGSIGFRLPECAFSQKLLGKCDFPVAAPSANMKGGRDPVCAEDVMADLDGYVDLVVDVGRTKYLKGSTVVRIAEGKIDLLREGVITAQEISQ